jgi:hypothetical protein
MQECCENEIRSSAAEGGVGGDGVVEWSDKHVRQHLIFSSMATKHTKLWAVGCGMGQPDGSDCM